MPFRHEPVEPFELREASVSALERTTWGNLSLPGNPSIAEGTQNRFSYKVFLLGRVHSTYTTFDARWLICHAHKPIQNTVIPHLRFLGFECWHEHRTSPQECFERGEKSGVPWRARQYRCIPSGCELSKDEHSIPEQCGSSRTGFILQVLPLDVDPPETAYQASGIFLIELSSQYPFS